MQYRNVNMNVGKHATYQRLLALKDRFWHADEVLPELEKLQPGDVQVGAAWGRWGWIWGPEIAVC